MRGLLIALAFFGSLWAIENIEMPAWFGVVTLGVMFTTATALGIKWVRNA